MRKKLLSLLAVLLLTASMTHTVWAEAPDFDVAGGHFFTQTSGADGQRGFAVEDDGRARFWSEFQRLGGVNAVGYPVSQRFDWDGFVVQAMQKGVLQWRPEVGRAYFVNVFDQLASAGKDDWLLTVRSTPRSLDVGFDSGKPSTRVVADRLALLEANAGMKRKYQSVGDSLNIFGLPTSRVVDNGNHYAIRLQRAVMQEWKEAVPWAARGQVTVANGGDVGKEAGLFPALGLQPAVYDRQLPSSRGGARPSSTQEVAIEIVNEYRSLAGAGPLALSDSLNRAAAAHASYYVQNYGDPSLAGMGLHVQKAGRPGFTGASWNDRARAAGYSDQVDENIGLVGDPKRAIDWFVETVNHRWNLLHPSAIHLGYGTAAMPAIDVLDIGFGLTRPSVALPTVYPGNGQQGVPVSANLRESPDPAPGVPRPLGFPITLSFHIADNVSFTSYGLTDGAGQEWPVVTSQKSWLRSIALIPTKPLRSRETYTARVAGMVNGQNFAKTWSFTTR